MNNLVTINPYSQKNIESYVQTSETDLELRLEAAQGCFNLWSQCTFEFKSQAFKKLSLLLRNEKIALATLATQEMGKPLSQSIAEIEKCALLCDYYLENAVTILKPKYISTKEVQAQIHYLPLGCILGVMPWNFPFWQVLRFAMPTLMAGNVVLLKHASNVSGCALKIQDLFERAGFPIGAFTTLLLSSDRVSSLISDFRIKAVSFTGSTAVGRKIAEVSGLHLKKTVLELGGSDPYLVLEKANIKLAAEVSMKSRLQNNGQSCVAAKRFIVHESIYEEFKKEIVLIAQKVQLGDPEDSQTEIGPIARLDLKIELEGQVNRALNEGASLLFQGQHVENSCFYPVTILENIKKSNFAFFEEFFGPVILLFKVSSNEEAVELANSTSFGLGAAIFTEDLELAQKIAIHQIQSGMCFINTMVRSDPKLPFGGIKASGYGRELSDSGLLEFVNIKSIGIKT